MLKVCRIVQWGLPSLLIAAYAIGVPTDIADVISVTLMAWIAKSIGDGIGDREVCHKNMEKYIAAGGLSAPAEHRRIEL